MKIVNHVFFLIFIIVFIYSCKQKRDLYPKEIKGGFELLNKDKTGIDFINRIKETDSLNQINFMQIFNGAGVGIGDVNNDGLADIYFCGNQVNDRLYLNKGNFEFEDISEKSGINEFSGWSNGVTMADVNADGLLDIYVSRSGPSLKLKSRQNRLFINKGNLTFQESSKTYGLSDYGFSTQAVFVDFDNDNDLDMYQVNQLPDPRLFNRERVSKKHFKYYSDRLYRNNRGIFQNISKEAGIGGLTHGLSVSASDFNNDGFIDFYVANDYDEPDVLYMNNGDGTFKNKINKSFKHISWFSMGTDAGDINNDGFMDLITLDMASDDHYRSKTNMGSMSAKKFNGLVTSGKHHQYMVNTLQLNTGNGSFLDIGEIAGISKTDWSWAPLFADLDNDGLKDIIISNGIKKDLRNNDFVQKVKSKLRKGKTDYLKMSNEVPSVPISNCIFKNTGQMKFEKVSSNWGFNSPSFSNGVAYGDLDNDGDLDIVTNNIGASAFVYENKATGNYLKIEFEGPENNKLGYGAKVSINQKGVCQTNENIVTRGYLSSVESGIFFGLGKNVDIENVQVAWPDGKICDYKNVSANQTLTAYYSDSKKTLKEEEVSNPFFKSVNPSDIGINFLHKENIYDDFEKQILLPHKLSQNGPFITKGDVNKDGLEDFFVGGASGQSGKLYLQKENSTFYEHSFQPWEKDKKSEDLGCVFIDIDNDEDLDLYVCSGGNEFENNNKLLEDRLYINKGKGEFIKDNSRIPNFRESTECVKKADIDEDGDMDLFVGGRLISGKYPFPANSHILINENGYLIDKTSTIAPVLKSCGLVTDVTFSDYDKDEDLDLIIVGEWMPITILENDKGVFKDKTKMLNLDKSQGLWWSIKAADIDNDGDDDYVIGNLGMNNKFKASKEKPLKVYATDFDNNGTNDVILAKSYKDDYVPLRGRECMSQQMPFISEKFTDYHNFASSKLTDILPNKKIEEAINYQIENFQSILLLNEGGHFVQKVLPIEAQVSTLKSVEILDVNKDGYKDLLVFGNHFPVEVETVRYDAGIGLLLLGKGNGEFKSVSSLKSGINVPYDSRDVQIINNKSGEKLVIITNNDAKISVLKSNY